MRQRRRMLLGTPLLVLVILLVPLAVPVEVQAAPDRCWTNKSQYRVGETVTFGAQLGYTDVYYYLIVYKPDGSYARFNVGYGPGTKYVSATVGSPTGQRTVQLRSGLGLHATCYFTVTGGGGGGGTAGYVRLYVYVYAGGYPLRGAVVTVYGKLRTVSKVTDSSGLAFLWIWPYGRSFVYSFTVTYQGRLLAGQDIWWGVSHDEKFVVRCSRDLRTCPIQ